MARDDCQPQGKSEESGLLKLADGQRRRQGRRDQTQAGRGQKASHRSRQRDQVAKGGLHGLSPSGIAGCSSSPVAKPHSSALDTLVNSP